MDEFGKDFWKPSTMIFDEIYKKYDTDLEDYVFVGNGQEDLEFAKNVKRNKICSC